MNSKLSKYGNKRMLLFLLLVVFSIFLLWYFFHPLSPHNERTRYIAAFREIGPVEGGKNVKIGGIPKGRIIRMDKTDSLIYVRFEIASDIRIPKDSKLHFASAGFLGSREIDIVLGSSPENYERGDTIYSTIFDKGLNTARADLEESFKHLGAAMVSAKAFFDDFSTGPEGRQIERLARKGKGIVRDANSDFESWKKGLDSAFDALSRSAATCDGKIREISAKIESSAEIGKSSLRDLEHLRETAKELGDQLSETLKKLDKNDNTAALVLQKGSELSQNLQSVQSHANALIRDIQKNGVKLNVDFF